MTEIRSLLFDIWSNSKKGQIMLLRNAYIHWLLLYFAEKTWSNENIMLIAKLWNTMVIISAKFTNIDKIYSICIVLWVKQNVIELKPQRSGSSCYKNPSSIFYLHTKTLHSCFVPMGSIKLPDRFLCCVFFKQHRNV